jgi:two-component sensor histidine kinase
MIVHELATNAAKYGALSNPDGELAVRWALEAGDLVLEWREVGGPRVSPPTRRGFGTRLVERGVQQDLGGASVMAFESDGLRCSIRFPMAAAAAQVA